MLPEVVPTPWNVKFPNHVIADPSLKYMTSVEAY
jgi:hypothetical protein